MQCPSCDRENRDGARFCASCGTSLILVCHECGTELLPDMGFCDACGTQVGPRPPDAVAERDSAATRALKRLAPSGYAERLLAARDKVTGERRIVTMLFSDVKGSTAMAEDLDPEEVMEIMDGAFDVLIEPIYRYEGTLARLMGDAILAFFGAPIAHEDDPERACRAALEIIQGAKRYAAQLEEERGIEGFNVRVGINTGLVVVGEVGSDLRVEYTAMGDAANLAARMESAAEPGTILITEDTHRLVAPLFETESLGPVQVKGKAEPVSVYRVLAPRVAPERLRGVAGLESPLVGREAEFRALQEAIERLETGLGGIVTLVGEAGLGKSRLVAELQRSPIASDLQWLEGRCLSYGTSVAYLLWLDMLRGLLRVSGDATPPSVRDALREWVVALCPEHCEDVYPYLGRLMALPLEAEDEAGIRDLGGEKLKAGTFRAVETLIRCSASQRPLVVVCEDLHWADPTSMELLEQLLPLTDRVPLLFVCLFRPQTEHGCWRIRETAARLYRHSHTDLWLNPLSAAESESLVGNLLRVEGLPEDLKERILQHAEGNPFYVEEIIRSLVDQGAIVRDEATGRWQATREVADIPIPDTLHGVLMARIDRLQDDTRRILQMAAVIGRIFLHRVLAAIAQEERELDGHVLTLQREQMIRARARIPELEYIFKHHLTQEAAYNGLLKKERRVFHRQVAEALERLFPERIDEQVGLLAHHWERAEEPHKAAEYLLRAGDQARLAYAHQEAVDYYQRALTFLKQLGEHQRAARTLMKLGLTHHTAFDFGRAHQAYEEGFALWQRAGQMQPALLPPAPHALRMSWSDPPTLDPSMANDATSGAVIDQLFSGLVELSPEMDVVPDVARSWDVLEDGRKYVFHLRDDVLWTDGTPLTAEDFEYAWKRVLDPATGSNNASLLYDVRGARDFHEGRVSDPGSVGVRAVDSVTLLVELEGPTGYLFQLLAHNATYPVPRHVVEAHGERWTDPQRIVTNGPFRLEGWQRGKLMLFVRNPEYHARFGGNLQRVELPLLSGEERSAGLGMYEADALDAVDITFFLASETVAARQRHAQEYVSEPELGTFFVAFDARRPPFDDPRVRRAFVLALDREALTEVVMRGLLFPATGGFVPPGMPGHCAGIALPYDPEGARELLAEAGYPGGRGFPVVETLAPEGLQAAELAKFFLVQWRGNLGVEILWERMDWATYLDRLDRSPPHMFGMGWTCDFPDPDNFLRVGLQRDRSGWTNEAYERLVEDARRAVDQEERMKLYGQAERILVEEAPIMLTAYGRRHRLVKPWVSRFPTSASRNWCWRDVVIEPH